MATLKSRFSPITLAILSWAIFTPLFAEEAKIPETVLEFAVESINKDLKMQGESPALPNKIEMANAPEKTKGALVYKFQYSGYRISCSLQLSVKKDKISKNKQRCWNHFGDESNPMP